MTSSGTWEYAAASKRNTRRTQYYRIYYMTRAIITVVGKDTVGIIAKVCNYLADNKINILDISQTIVQDFFNMMMIVDLTACERQFTDISAELTQVGEDIGVVVKCQLEDIFNKMHRI